MKYQLTKQSRAINGHTLFQIQSLTNFNNVKKGDLGGWVETENNLSQEGCCWIYDNACVYQGAKVNKNASVKGNAQLSGCCVVAGNAVVEHSAKITDFVIVRDHAKIMNSASLSQNVIIHENAMIKDNTSITGSVIIGNYDVISGDVCISSNQTKYHLNKKETMKINGEILYQIIADISFDSVKAGDVGGYIAGEQCLSHYGHCWVEKGAYLLSKESLNEDQIKKVSSSKKSKTTETYSTGSSNDVLADTVVVEAAIETIGAIIGSLFD